VSVATTSKAEATNNRCPREGEGMGMLMGLVKNEPGPREKLLGIEPGKAAIWR